MLLVAAGWLAFSQNTVEAPEVGIEDSLLQEPAEPVEPVGEETAIGPENTVEQFLSNFIASAPPESDELAYGAAVSLLSQGARTSAMTDEEGKIVLPLLVGVQDLPDMGYEVLAVEYQEDLLNDEEEVLAQVTVELRYSGGDVERVFMLSKVNGDWLIDDITQG
ncbi:MAG: hypothetical protein PHR64_00035 [Candidatus Shapirobacteria bacterium]|nr:hypothetical protein [Candidatus Shapirobacteria bacterium]MDD5073574.1 hypothetical protein [Candidatus Shapirobacteria bacterium]MDD5481327.1 hypothetical protein [Candidatus Shapirobacteria bacterium]